MSSRFSQHNSRNSVFSEYPTLCSDIRNFIARCREEQTLFVNLEGQFEKRCFKRNEQDSLISYVSETIENKFDHGQTALLLSNKILSFQSGSNDVYCSNFWLYYYKYEDKSIHPIPLFKVFKGKETDDFFILDTKMVFYNNFDNFLDAIELPLSFICVPRNGRYDFVGDKLSLEFICSSTNINADTDFAPYTTYSQRIYRCFATFSMVKLKENFLSIVVNFIEFLKGLSCNVGSKLTYLKLIVTSFIDKKRSLSGSAFDTDALMLCDVRKKAIGKENPRMGDKELTQLRDGLLVQLNNPKGHWKEIIRNICEITLRFTPILSCSFLNVLKLHPWLKAIMSVILIVTTLAKMGIQALDCYESLTDSVTSRNIKFSGNDGQSQKNDPCPQTINYEVAMENLSQLSTMPASTFANLYTEEPTPAAETRIEVLSPKDGFKFLGVEDGLAFFISGANLFHMNYYADMFKALIKPDGPNRSKIIKETPKGNKDIGALYYASEFVVMGFINEEELPEGMNVRDRIKRENKELSALSF